MVEMEFVQSRNVESVGYDDENAELHVLFKSSPSKYVYQGVPRDVYDRLVAAPSKGEFLHREVKNVYPFYRA